VLGSASLLYKSIHKKLFALPEHYNVYPAHDYKGEMCSSIGEEKRYNPRLILSEEKFVEVMKNLNLPYPKQIGKYSIF
jgi:sulfur dioxygenase